MTQWYEICQKYNVTLLELNPTINYQIDKERLDEKNVKKILERYDVILDCTDNEISRYLVHDTCFQLKKFINGSALGLEGHISVFNFQYQKFPCYRCCFPKPFRQVW